MDKYRRVEKAKETLVKDDEEIRITAMGSVSAYVSRAATVFNELKKDQIVIKATGNALSKAVTLAEVVKRRFADLHQITSIGSTEIVDEYEPLEEGLDKVVDTRTVAVVEIKLSKVALDTSDKGYQAPVDSSLVTEYDPEQLTKARGRGRGKGRGKGKGKGKGKAPPEPEEKPAKGKGKGKVEPPAPAAKGSKAAGKGSKGTKGAKGGLYEEPLAKGGKKGKGGKKDGWDDYGYDYDYYDYGYSSGSGKGGKKGGGKGKSSSWDDWGASYDAYGYGSTGGGKGKGKDKGKTKGKGKGKPSNWY